MIMFHEIRPYPRQTLSAISLHCCNPKFNHTQPGCPKATSQLMDHLHPVRHTIRARTLIQTASLCTETLEVHLCHLLPDEWLVQSLVKTHHQITHSHTRQN